ncbi:MAG: polyprenyl synthetase family protein [Sulfuriferula sp.]
MNPDFLAWSGNLQARIETTLSRLLPDPQHAPPTLHAAMHYATLGGGKRVRPLLAFAAGEVVGADPARVEIAASAVELIHAYSLVHDDLPCMDNDVLRRGKPTCHVEYGEATALLAGDSLQSLAFELLTTHTLSDTPERQLEMVKLLANAAGSRGMAGGQAIDLASVGQTLTLPELEFMHIHKTGALIRASVLLGTYCGNTLDDTALAKLDHYAKCVGLAFQVVDDILDAEAPTATLGKTAGKDAENNKPTYVTLMGSARAKTFAAELHKDALDSLAGFDSAQRLRELADFIVQRQF